MAVYYEVNPSLKSFKPLFESAMKSSFFSVVALLYASFFVSIVSAQDRKPDDVKGLTKYATVKLTADPSKLDDNHRKMIPHLIAAAKQMDKAFWYQAYGNPKDIAISKNLPAKVARQLRTHVKINYGPWERLQESRPFLSGVKDKPKGANFYPADMTKQQFEDQVKDNPALKSLYTFVRWDDSNNK